MTPSWRLWSKECSQAFNEGSPSKMMVDTSPGTEYAVPLLSLSSLSLSLSLSETFSLTLTTSIYLSAPLLLLSLSFSPLPVVNTIYSCWIVGSFCLWRYHYGSCLLGKLLSWKVLLPTWFLIYGHQSSLLISITDSCTYPFNVAFSLSLPLSLSLSLSLPIVLHVMPNGISYLATPYWMAG